MEGEPLTLDPRKVRDLETATVIHMIYEGLMRNENGSSTPAIAQSVDISEDQKTYVFHLRDTRWSNGDLVTAFDFENTWKSLLEPHFPSPNAYQLYVIRGSQAAKEGKEAIGTVGIQAIDAKTLKVELEQPTPYFLSLVSTYFFYPIHSSILNGTIPPSDHIITNGPFMIEAWKHHSELTTIPNPHYWDKNAVKLERIQLVTLENNTALQLFHQGELDWSGSPLSTLTIDSLASLRNGEKLEIAPAAGVYFMRVNTEQPPFNSIKMRQAFALSINRADLVEFVLQGNQRPAFGLVPYSFLEGQPHFEDNAIHLASQFFKEAMDELGITLESFPKTTIHYAAGERAHKIAQVAQQQWKKALGVDVLLQSNESKIHFDLLKNHNYHLSIGSWFADFHDPIAFLEIFKRKENGTNNTQWENEIYRQLLQISALQTDSNERKQTLKQAERILINEMPIIPLFYASYNYVKNPAVKGVYFSDLGYLDFKHASLVE